MRAAANAAAGIAATGPAGRAARKNFRTSKKPGG